MAGPGSSKKPMAKSKHKRKKAKRVAQWAVWLEARGHYYLNLNDAVILYRTKDEAEHVAMLFHPDVEPCRVDHVLLRKI